MRLSVDSPNRHSQLLLIIAIFVGITTSASALYPLQESLRATLSLTDNHIALLQGPAYAWPVILTGVPLGLLVDRYSRVAIILFLTVIVLIAAVLAAFSVNLWTLLLSRILLAPAINGIGVALLSLIADFYVASERGRAKGVYFVAGYAAKSATFVGAGFLLLEFGATPDGWRWVLLLLNVPMALSILATIVLKEPIRSQIGRQSLKTGESWRLFLSHKRRLLPLIVGIAIAEIIIGGVLIWSAPTFARVFSLRPDHVGAVVGIVLFISGAFGPLLGGMIADWCQRADRPVRSMRILAGITLASAPGGVFALSNNVGLAVALLVVFMTLVTAATGMAWTIFTVVVPHELRGFCFSILNIVQMMFALGIAPVMVSLLSGQLGGPQMIGKALAITWIVSGVLAGFVFAYGSTLFRVNHPIQTIANPAQGGL